jgi:hypothetical protein
MDIYNLKLSKDPVYNSLGNSINDTMEKQEIEKKIIGDLILPTTDSNNIDGLSNNDNISENNNLDDNNIDGLNRKSSNNIDGLSNNNIRENDNLDDNNIDGLNRKSSNNINGLSNNNIRENDNLDNNIDGLNRKSSNNDNNLDDYSDISEEEFFDYSNNVLLLNDNYNSMENEDLVFNDDLIFNDDGYNEYNNLRKKPKKFKPNTYTKSFIRNDIIPDELENEYNDEIPYYEINTNTNNTNNINVVKKWDCSDPNLPPYQKCTVNLDKVKKTDINPADFENSRFNTGEEE